MPDQVKLTGTDHQIKSDASVLFDLVIHTCQREVYLYNKEIPV